MLLYTLAFRSLCGTCKIFCDLNLYSFLGHPSSISSKSNSIHVDVYSYPFAEVNAECETVIKPDFRVVAKQLKVQVYLFNMFNFFYVHMNHQDFTLNRRPIFVRS